MNRGGSTVMGRGAVLLTLLLAPLAAVAGSGQEFVNWETPHVYPLEMTPSGSKLLAVNTPDNRLEVFDLTSGQPVPAGSVFVGLDPVSVRARSDSEAWVMNQISDTISIVDLATLRVRATLSTCDEPADAIFAGAPERAFVSCSQANQVMVFDPDNLALQPTILDIVAEDPRAMAVSPSGDKVYVAVFESGNGSTVLSGDNAALPTALDDPQGPHGGVNPPPNDGNQFDPPIAPGLPAPPFTSLIVKKNAVGQWMDDNSGDWTRWVTGDKASLDERHPGWDLPDRDVAVIDTATLAVSYFDRLMNLNMNLAVNPATGDLAVIGTDGINEVRFEPNLNGVFLRVLFVSMAPDGGGASLVDLNPHVDYTQATLPVEERERSLGDPRAIAFNQAGTQAWIAGMGSNNVIAVDASGARLPGDPIEVGEGPTGLVVDEARDRIYVLNKFEAAISVLSLSGASELDRIALFDPSPAAIKIGRKQLYDTHATSGTGLVACASCHVDARWDRLAWDLGNPQGEMKDTEPQNEGEWNQGLGFFFRDWHPMKGPMMTQVLQDIIGFEPHHWRGDKDGLEEFNVTFTNLQGRPSEITAQEMQEFEDFLATIHYPPNPYRNFDNTLPTDMPLPGHFAVGKFAAEGTPFPNGNAQTGLELFMLPSRIDTPFACSTCHTLPTGVGPNVRLQGGNLVEIPDGPNGEKHSGLVSIDGTRNVTMKVPQMRNLYEIVPGFDKTQLENTTGFGMTHDGAFDNMARFFRQGFPGFTNFQEYADLTAFLMAFSGSDLPDPTIPNNPDEPPGPPSQDAHAAVGAQVTIADGGAVPTPDRQRLQEMRLLANGGAIGLIAKTTVDGVERGWTWSGGRFQSDIGVESASFQSLVTGAAPGAEVTVTVVPAGMETRAGVDRDSDGFFDGDERAACSDGSDGASLPGPFFDISSGPLTAGQQNTFGTSCTIPGRTVQVYLSLVGPGSTDTPFGEIGLANARGLGQAVVDNDGLAEVLRNLPGAAAGRQAWWQAIDDAGTTSDIETGTIQ